jgi:hypothetical protein
MFTEKQLEKSLREKKICIVCGVLQGFFAMLVIGIGAGIHSLPVIATGLGFGVVALIVAMASYDSQREHDIMVLSNKIEEIKK